jgi:hypothetical protein
VLAAGCGHGGSHVATPVTRSTPVTSAVVTAPGKPGNVSIAPADVANRPADRKNVTMTSCAGGVSGWQGRGTARNASGSPVTYRVTLFYTTQQGTVVGNSSTQVTVPGHGHADWSTSAKIASKGPLRCVLRGVAAL